MLDTTRTLTGQEVVVLMGDKDDALGTYTLGNAGNVSKWIANITPQRVTNDQDRTSLGAGTNAVTAMQPGGTLTVSYQINWLGNPDVLKYIKPMELENRLGLYVYSFKLVYGIASSDNHFESAGGYHKNFTPSGNPSSLIAATSTFVVTQSYAEGQTTGMLT